MRCVLVDDEPLACERLAALLADADTPIAVVGTAHSGQAAIPLIYETRPDVIFLDVQMPVLDGFDVVELLAPPRPHIVFVTAYDAYALRAFDVHALDYLTKPVRLARLNRTVAHLQERLPAANQTKNLQALHNERPLQPLQRLTVHAGRRLRVVPVDAIYCIEAETKLVFVHIAEGRYPTDFTLDTLEKRLDSDAFLRIHRSYLVPIAHIQELIPTSTGRAFVRLKDGRTLPVARRRIRNIKQHLSGEP